MPLRGRPPLRHLLVLIPALFAIIDETMEVIMGAAFANLLLTLWIIHAADSPQTIIDQAIKARGGSDQLGQIKAFQAKTKGHIYVGESALSFTTTIQSQLPDQYTHVIDYQRDG